MIPDYFDVVDEKSVITWRILQSRRHTSRKNFIEDIEQILYNARAYNIGISIPRIAEDGTKTYVDVGPGAHGFPQLVPMVVEFATGVSRLLYSSLAEQAQAAELKVLGGYLVTMSLTQGAETQWAGCDECEKWRVVDGETIKQVETGASYTCSSDKGRPIRGCNESWNSQDDEPLLSQAKAALMY